jgi:hypothetical protein
MSVGEVLILSIGIITVGACFVLALIVASAVRRLMR